MASAIFALEKQSSFISATSKATRLTNKTAVSNQSDEEDKIENAELATTPHTKWFTFLDHELELEFQRDYWEHSGNRKRFIDVLLYAAFLGYFTTVLLQLAFDYYWLSAIFFGHVPATCTLFGYYYLKNNKNAAYRCQFVAALSLWLYYYLTFMGEYLMVQDIQDSPFQITACVCMMSVGPFIGFRGKAGLALLWVTFINFLCTVAFVEWMNQSFVEKCFTSIYEVDFGVAELMLMVAGMMHFSILRLERNARDSFLHRRYLKQQKLVLISKLSSLDMIERGVVAADDETRAWLYRDFASSTRAAKAEAGGSTSRPLSTMTGHGSLARSQTLLPSSVPSNGSGSSMQPQPQTGSNTPFESRYDNVFFEILGIRDVMTVFDPLMLDVMTRNNDFDGMGDGGDAEAGLGVRNQLLYLTLAIIHHGRNGNVDRWIRSNYYDGTKSNTDGDGDDDKSGCFVTRALSVYESLERKHPMTSKTPKQRLFSELMSELQSKLSVLNRDFDAFSFSKSMSCRGDSPLTFLAVVMTDKWNLFSSFPTMDLNYFINFMFSEVRDEYDDVMVQLMAVLFAAVVHDADHPGVNNQYLITLRNKLALSYNDKSVLENHHLSTCYNILVHGTSYSPLSEKLKKRASEMKGIKLDVGASEGRLCCDFISTCFLKRINTMTLSIKPSVDKKDQIRFDPILIRDFEIPSDDTWLQPVVLFRDLVVKCVLATDMKMHFEMVAQLKSQIASGTLTASGVNMNDIDKRHFVLTIAMKVADLGQIIRPLKVTCMPHDCIDSYMLVDWTKRVNDEFFAQGDLEASYGLPISPFYDRSKANVPKSQIGFIDFVIIPLFSAWSDLTTARWIRDRLEQCRMFWNRHVTYDDVIIIMYRLLEQRVTDVDAIVV